MNTPLPNILFVFADQLRACSLGYEGEEKVQTPRLDAFAGEGIRLTNAISGCPVCTPYRAMLLTGKYPLSTGMFMNDLRLPEDEMTLSEVLQQSGYRTGYVGKWHLDGPERGAFTPPGKRRHGFDFWAVYNCHHQYLRPFYYRDTPERLEREGYEPTITADFALDFLEETSRRDQPFCLFVSWGPPHDPYLELPDHLTGLYDAETLPHRPNADQSFLRDLAGYYSHITGLDREMGRLLDALDSLNLAQNTIVVFTSDHGDMLGSQNHVRKQRPWEESIRVPFLIRLPGEIGKGKQSDVLLNAPDIMPTILGFAGIEIPQGVEGLDLSRTISGENGPDPESALILNPVPFAEAFRVGIPAWRGVRTKRYTYVKTLEGPWLLYDNIEDPFQQRNLIEINPSHPAIPILEEELRGWLARTGDEFLPPVYLLDRWCYEVDERGQIPYIP